MSVESMGLQDVSGIPISCISLVQLLKDHDSNELELRIGFPHQTNRTFLKIGERMAAYLDHLRADSPEKSFSPMLKEEFRDVRVLADQGIIAVDNKDSSGGTVEDYFCTRGPAYEATRVVGVRKPVSRVARFFSSPKYIPVRGQF